MPDVLVDEKEYARVLAERAEYREKLAAYEAAYDLAPLLEKLNRANRRVAFFTKRLGVIEAALLALGILTLHCPTCKGKGVISTSYAGGRGIQPDNAPADSVCPDCAGAKIIYIE
jgi:hypothetical protein